MTNDSINHPAHYTKYKTEVIDITRYLPFCLGNVVKYVLRAPYKGGVEDCDKALQYLEWCDGKLYMLLDDAILLHDNIAGLARDLRYGLGAEPVQYEFLCRLYECAIVNGDYAALREPIEKLRELCANV